MAIAGSHYRADLLVGMQVGASADDLRETAIFESLAYYGEIATRGLLGRLRTEPRPRRPRFGYGRSPSLRLRC